jgi:hypothetical protein
MTASILLRCGLVGSAMMLSTASHAADIPATIETVIIGPFSADDRTRIAQALDEWNRALNGVSRFAPAADTNGRRVWAITAIAQSPVQNRRETLAEVKALPAGGGLLMVYVDRLRGKNLDGIMLHELGHVLGLQHEGSRGLMAAEYNPHDQKCVDYPALAQLAALYGLPLQRLRWCGEATPAR